MALLPGSPAIDAGDPLASPPTDQRGVGRPGGPRPDIGAFELVVDEPLKLTLQPLSQTRTVGERVVFEVAVNRVNASLQWKFDGTVLPGETNSSLVSAEVQLTHAGEYLVEVSDSLETIVSAPAVLTVVPAPEPVVLGKLIRGDTSAQLEVQTEEGTTYTLERSVTLVPAAWSAVQTVAGDGSKQMLTDTNAVDSQCFYRVGAERN